MRVELPDVMAPTASRAGDQMRRSYCFSSGRNVIDATRRGLVPCALPCGASGSR